MINYLRNDDILAITTNRYDGVSSGPYESANFGFRTLDNKENVEANYQILRNKLEINKENIYFTRQVHSDIFIEITKDSLNYQKRCDALFTLEKNCYLTVLSADCLPILFYCPDREIVGAIHAGWLGSAKLIAFKLLSYLISNYQVDPQQVIVYFGPSIFSEVYEVGQDVYDKVCQHEIFNPQVCFQAKDNGKYWYDNRLFNQLQLEFLGIKQIVKLDECTYQNSEYFSYRRQPESGRQLSLIGMREK